MLEVRRAHSTCKVCVLGCSVCWCAGGGCNGARLPSNAIVGFPRGLPGLSFGVPSPQTSPHTARYVHRRRVLLRGWNLWSSPSGNNSLQGPLSWSPLKTPRVEREPDHRGTQRGHSDDQIQGPLHQRFFSGLSWTNSHQWYSRHNGQPIPRHSCFPPFNFHQCFAVLPSCALNKFANNS